MFDFFCISGLMPCPSYIGTSRHPPEHCETLPPRTKPYNVFAISEIVLRSEHHPITYVICACFQLLLCCLACMFVASRESSMHAIRPRVMFMALGSRRSSEKMLQFRLLRSGARMVFLIRGSCARTLYMNKLAVTNAPLCRFQKFLP